MLSALLKFLLFTTGQLQRHLDSLDSQEVPSTSVPVPTEGTPPAAFLPIDLVQRPLDHNGKEILSCSLPKGAACGTNVGKSLSSYCTCAEGLACTDNVCIEDGLTNDPAVLDPNIDMVQRPMSFSADPNFSPQRPSLGNGRYIMSCTMGLGEECRSRRGKDMHSYCSCGSGLVCGPRVEGKRVCIRDGSGTAPQVKPRIDNVQP